MERNNMSKENIIIPKGFKHIANNYVFTIERKSDGSRFFWIPAVVTDSCNFIEAPNYYGRFYTTNYMYDPKTKERELQIESIKKYGGLYVSSYCISFNSEKNIYQSIKGVKSIGNVKQEEAAKIATFVESKLKSHLLYGFECDAICEHIITSPPKTQKVLQKYYGGKFIWTQERKTTGNAITRHDNNYGFCDTDAVAMAHRFDTIPKYEAQNLGLFVALIIE